MGARSPDEKGRIARFVHVLMRRRAAAGGPVRPCEDAEPPGQCESPRRFLGSRATIFAAGLIGWYSRSADMRALRRNSVFAELRYSKEKYFRIVNATRVDLQFYIEILLLLSKISARVTIRVFYPTFSRPGPIVQRIGRAWPTGAPL